MAPAISDAQDIRAQRARDQQDLELKKAQLTAQQFVAQAEQQRIRAGNQPVPRGDPYWDGTKMVQPVLDPEKGLALADAPWAETPQAKVKKFADEYQQVYGKPMPDDVNRQVISQVYGLPFPNYI